MIRVSLRKTSAILTAQDVLPCLFEHLSQVAPLRKRKPKRREKLPEYQEDRHIPDRTARSRPRHLHLQKKFVFLREWCYILVNFLQ